MTFPTLVSSNETTTFHENLVHGFRNLVSEAHCAVAAPRSPEIRSVQSNAVEAFSPPVAGGLWTSAHVLNSKHSL